MRNPVVALVLGLALAGGVLAGCGGTDSAQTAAEPAPAPAPAPAAPSPAEPAAPAPAEPAAPAPSEPPAGGGNAAAGKTIFTKAGCAACHTLAAAGASGTVGPNLDELKPGLAAVIAQVTNGGGVMPPFRGQLTEQQIENVAAFVVQATSGKTSGGGGAQTTTSDDDGDGHGGRGEDHGGGDDDSGGMY